MHYLNTFFYYTFFASGVLFYGIGLNQATEFTVLTEKRFAYVIKILLSIFLSTILSWVVTSLILVPIHLVEIFPIVTFLIYICITAFIEALIRLTTGKSTTEFIFSYLVVLLSIYESTTIVDAIIISGSCILALIILMPFILAFKTRITNDFNDIEKYFCKFLFFLSILILTISVWDIMWINPEVLK
ncbi:MAG: hypothetical protein MJ188_09780 [Treponema sp.]|nr:hypothetical protein [Treponema sp.]